MNFRRLNIVLALTAALEIAVYINVVQKVPLPAVLGDSDEVALETVVLPTFSNEAIISNPYNVIPLSYLALQTSTTEPRPTVNITATPTITSIPVRVANVESSMINENSPSIKVFQAPVDIQATILQYSNQYGVNSDLMIKIAKCESGFNPGAVNGPYGGIYQFLSSTWSSNRRAMGLDANPDLRFDAEEAIKTAAYKISRDGAGAWPTCSVI